MKFASRNRAIVRGCVPLPRNQKQPDERHQAHASHNHGTPSTATTVDAAARTAATLIAPAFHAPHPPLLCSTPAPLCSAPPCLCHPHSSHLSPHRHLKMCATLSYVSQSTDPTLPKSPMYLRKRACQCESQKPASNTSTKHNRWLSPLSSISWPMYNTHTYLLLPAPGLDSGQVKRKSESSQAMNRSLACSLTAYSDFNSHHSSSVQAQNKYPFQLAQLGQPRPGSLASVSLGPTPSGKGMKRREEKKTVALVICLWPRSMAM